MMNDLMGFISTVGFPIVIALYSLITLNTTMKDNTRVMNAIADKLDIQNRNGGSIK